MAEFAHPMEDQDNVTAAWRSLLLETGLGGYNSSREFVGNHENLVAEILCRADIKDIGRCCTVSKYWNIIISSTWFHHMRMRMSQKKLMLCYDSYEQGKRLKIMSEIQVSGDTRREERQDVTISGVPTQDPKIIGSSILGIICLVLTQRRNFLGDIILVNPTLNKCQNLPAMPNFERGRLTGKRSNVSYAFWGSTRNGVNDFRVAVLSMGSYLCIFTTRTWEWLNLDYSPLLGEGSPVDSGAFSNGFLYWFMQFDDGTKPRILKINPENLVDNDRLELPVDNVSVARLDSLNDDLSLICFKLDRISFWVREKDQVWRHVINVRPGLDTDDISFWVPKEEDQFWMNAINPRPAIPRYFPSYCRFIHMENGHLLLKVGIRIWKKKNSDGLWVKIPGVPFVKDGIVYTPSVIPPPCHPILN